MNLQFGNDLVFVNKPAGWSTHSPDPQRLGMAELVEHELHARGINKKVHVVHRLDKTTTGALVFATSELRARDLFEKFQKHEVHKKYLFLTAATSDAKTLSAQSLITKNAKSLSNDPKADPNAWTDFKKLKLNSLYEQWEAYPKSGKTHQIRLHAQQLGMSILGDTIYGGKNFSHLCLHAAELHLSGEEKFTAFAPVFFDRMGILHDDELVQILSAVDLRQRMLGFLKNQAATMRLSHLETKKIRMDLFGPQLWIYWYDSNPPSEKWLARFEFVAGLIGRKYYLRLMQNRGADPASRISWGDAAEQWTCKENDLNFEMRRDQGLSPGLFLDQRQNRKKVSNVVTDLVAQKKSCRALNLFSYTCGFSLAAARAGADEVISVDISRSFLEWGKKNFSLNDLAPEKYNFFAMDSIEFLEKAVKGKRQYDLILCDPPSFGRHPKNKKVFRLEKEFDSLLQKLFSVTAPGGYLMFSTNYEHWTYLDLQEKITSLFPRGWEILSPEPSGLDYELPGQEPLMKSFWMKRK